ncbi:MAG TPA: radical SAM protein [Thermodesulfobacteriota bacterium]|nr:radical SAM protein [Thermodesulfobacteriota bacterium]
MINKLIQLPLAELQSAAFKIRKAHFGNELTFSVPGTVTYRDSTLPVQKDKFAAISVTGSHCDLGCSHCKGKLLEAMIPAEDPDTFLQVADRLRLNGALGVLVSGGADRNGEVPLRKFIPAIKALKENNPQFKVIVHTGLIRRAIAKALKDAEVDQILIDVIGDDDTIREVYHLNKRVNDYEETLWLLKEMGHRLAPHIIIGHHFGELRGEWRALEMVTRVGVETIVLVVFKTLSPSEKDRFKLPNPEETSKICALARILNPDIPIRLGCIRPAHRSKGATERGAIDSGINTITYPLQGTLDYAKEIGLKTKFVEMCCSLVQTND